MIQTVFFDLGNVLVFFSHEKMIQQISDCTGLSVSEIRTFLADLAPRYESGAIEGQEILRIFRAAAPKSFTPEQFFLAASDIFTPNDPVYPIVHALKEKKVRLLLLSNTSPAHFEFLIPRYPVLQLFDAKILSYEVGAMKPHPAIYRAAIDAAEAPAHRCFFTDDVPAFVAGAKALGIDAQLFRGAAALRDDLRLRGLL